VGYIEEGGGGGVWEVGVIVLTTHAHRCKRRAVRTYIHIYIYIGMCTLRMGKLSPSERKCRESSSEEKTGEKLVERVLLKVL